MTTTSRRPPAARLRTAARLGAAAALLSGLTACAAPRGPQVTLADAAGAGCGVGAAADDARRGSRRAPDTLRIGAPGPLEGRHPPVPSSWAERIAYRHLYGTLVEVDCRGRVEPGLASSWSSADGGRRWTFRLRPGMAGTAAEGWRRAGLLDTPPGGPGPRPSALSVGPDGEELTVTLSSPLATPGLFAEPRFAVTDGGPPIGLLPGTGTHTLASTPPGRNGEGWVLAPRSGGGTALAVVGHRGGAGGRAPRPRDLLDRGVELVVTLRPAARRYAASLEGYSVEPLPWDRTYVLLVPGPRRAGAGGRPAGNGAGARRGGGDGPPPVLRDLARDAVRADARASVPPHWWEATCGSDDRSATDGSGPRVRRPGRDGPPSGAPPRLVHPEGDPTAGDIAARLAALSGPGGEPDETGVLAPALEAAGGTEERLRPAALPPHRFDDALRAGGDAGYVLPLPRRALVPCWSRGRLRRRVPWLASGGTRLLPLVDVRPHLAVRRGVAGVRLDWDGVPRLTAPVDPPERRTP